MKKCKVRLDFDEITEIGQEGRNSKVFIAHDNQLDADIVVKEIDKSIFHSPNEYFKEARILYANKHENIVNVYFACEDDNKIYIAMPYYKNGSLKNRISNGNFLTVREVIRYSIQFLSGLNHIHSKHLIHFDIKPDNVLISDSNIAMLSDFGLASYTDSSGFCISERFYTPHVTPEEIKGLRQTIKNDIYQAGITMYRMVNGNEWFYQQIDENNFKDNVINGKFPDRKCYLPHIPKKLKAIINKCINVDPNSRYDNTLQIINELSKIEDLLDIKFKSDSNTQYWYIPRENFNYKIELSSENDRFNIKVYKIKDARVTNCPSKCLYNIEGNVVHKELIKLFEYYEQKSYK